MHPGVLRGLADTHFKASITLLRVPDKRHPRLQGGGPGELQAGQTNLSGCEDSRGNFYES